MIFFIFSRNMHVTNNLKSFSFIKNLNQLTFTNFLLHFNHIIFLWFYVFLSSYLLGYAQGLPHFALKNRVWFANGCLSVILCFQFSICIFELEISQSLNAKTFIQNFFFSKSSTITALARSILLVLNWPNFFSVFSFFGLSLRRCRWASILQILRSLSL